MRSRAHRPTGSRPVDLRRSNMANLKGQKPKKKQRRSFLPRIDIIAAAAYWIVRLVLLLIDWFSK